MPNFLINVTTRGAKAAGSSIKRLSGSLMKLSKVAMVGAAGGAIALGVAMKKATLAAAEQELQEKKLTTALGKNADALIKQAGALQQSSRFGDEAIIQQQAYLASIGMSEQQIREMIPVTLDLAAATGMSLEAAVKNTAKTLSGMTGELGESVAPLRELTAEELKAGDGIKLMGEMFKGLAENETKTFTGAMDQAKNAMGDAAESLGALLLPMATDGAKTMKRFSEQSIEAFDFLGKIDFGKTFENMKTNMGALTGMIKDTFKLVFSAIPDLFGFFMGKIVPAGLKVLELLWDGVKFVAKFLFEPIPIAFNMAVTRIKIFFTEMWAGIKEIGADGINTMIDQFNEFIKKAPNIAEALGIEEIKSITVESVADASKALKEEMEKLKADLAGTSMIALLIEGSEDDLDSLSDFTDAQLEIYKKYASQIIELDNEVEDNKDENDKKADGDRKKKNKKKEEGKKSEIEKELAGYAKSSGAAEDAMKSVVKAESMEAVAGLIASIFKTVPFPFNAILAAGAGATVSGVIDKGLASFAEGGDFVTNGKQMIMVGDNPSGREHIQITPLGGDPAPNAPGGGTNITLNISAPLVDESVVDHIIPAINEAIRRGETLATG